ncbi:ATP-dependent RNA helicase DDX49/DBP8 [Angomonas deanei]|uniref:Probable eukaryotic initiation factor 4A n=1 Tax=Angomonas deanei TaxID=59799 RepID=A0A7G2CRR5_9TRYP|nr:ATP-dependent RNA helicase DDX49/DBP8 [Angomonas deanei]CAD2222486.1 Type III restriction enzyme, res subunit/DEAD/DEAH box helicase/Helicase conserved C-terminal domain containing protein, putative [Angomonas deanei]|eukprot:EPY34063.1 ATP-dependent RNA helicase DDX49/DBP8 [Angomonas deanei]
MSEFEKIGLQPWLAKQCSYMALDSPTPIQQKCIPVILGSSETEPTHVIGQAATGSGKTAAFALPILQTLSSDMYGVFALVLTPSRELAYQIVDQFVAFGAPLRPRCMLAIGGVRHEDQVDALRNRPHIVVATPGRLMHLFRVFPRETLPAFSHLRFLVLDEADRLSEGDITTDVRSILQTLPPAQPFRQSLLFSATMNAELTDFDAKGEEGEENILTQLGIKPSSLQRFSVASESAIEPFQRSVPEDSKTQISFPDTLEQHYVFIPNMVKLPNLTAALRAGGKEQTTIVFVNSALRAEIVRLALQLLGFPVSSLDSLLTQQQRLDHLALFKLSLSRVLVCTDIASRGLDIPDVDVVIHYDIPKEATTYVHRVGRTARAGKSGKSIAFVTEYDISLIQRIEKKIKVKLTQWKEKALREERIVKILEEVSAAKVQAKQQVTEQYQNRVETRKSQAAEKKQKRATGIKRSRPDSQPNEQTTKKNTKLKKKKTV